MVYDVAIIGGGPAGLAAGIYAGRAKLKTVILTNGKCGGQAATTREIVNYPGFFKDTTGPGLMKSWEEHARFFDVKILEKEEVVAVDFTHEKKLLITRSAKKLESQTVVLAPGSEPRLLNIPGELSFRGQGVSYCATCDAEFYEELTVGVVGNGDAAIEESLYLTKFAKKVIVIVLHEEGRLDCNKISAEKAFNNPKIEFMWNSTLEAIRGDFEVEEIVVKNLQTGESTALSVAGVFIYIGSRPRSKFLKGKVAMTEGGYIVTDEKMNTSVAGVLAAGDARDKYFRQVVTAASDGATAAVSAERYLLEEEDYREQFLHAKDPVVAYFWSPLKQDSIKKLSLVGNLLTKLDSHLKLVKIDVSKNERIAKKFNISQIPACIVVNQGRVVTDLSEVMAAGDLAIESALKDLELT